MHFLPLSVALESHHILIAVSLSLTVGVHHVCFAALLLHSVRVIDSILKHLIRYTKLSGPVG